METQPSILFPKIVIPPVKTYETISIPLPTADVPSYIPLVVPPSDLEAPEGVQAAVSYTHLTLPTSDLV